MDNQTLEKILEHNKKFYEDIAGEFSVTRQYPWRGWGRVINEISPNISELENEKLKIFDVACGNGRFYSFLQDNFAKEFVYKGIDSSEQLLAVAGSRYGNVGNVSFQKMDVLSDMNMINDVYNVICVFGFMHHIPSKKLRLMLLNSLAEILEKHGYLVITMWQTENNNRFFPANSTVIAEKAGINIELLEKGDAFLYWGKDKDNIRFVHNFSEEEILELEQMLNKKGMRLVTSFLSDGNQNDLNKYLIYQKT